jgi:hypothetical protein
VRNRDGRMNRTVDKDEEKSMDQMIVCVMAMVALRWWASVAFHPVQRISAWRQVSDGLYTIS